MSSRTVSVVLSAQVQNYLTNMRAAEAQTLALEKSTKTATQQFAAHNQALQAVGIGMLAVGATAAAGLAIAVKASAEFGAKMAQLQSLSHANSATMKQLSDAAMTVGTAYGVSATKVADAQIELVKAGVGVKAQLGGALVGALTLAAAGQLDVAQATEITTVAMTQFQLSAKDVPHLADLLAAGADKALGSVADLGEGLKNGGLQAHNMGLTIEDTVGLLSAFANAGILGAEAGTQMRSMFLRLQNPTTAAKQTLDQYGISINDASGKFVGITKFADELHDRLDGLSQAQRNQALATVFGSHAIVGATVLYQDGGKAAEKAGNSIADWIKNVDASGFASAQAAGKMNSLQGDVQKLGAVFQTDLIKAGSSADGALRPLLQTTTGLLGAMGAIPQPVAAAGTAVAVLVAGVGLLGGAALIAVPKVVAFKASLDELGISGKEAGKTFAKGAALSAGLAVIAAGLSGVGQQGTATSQQIELTGETARKSFKDLDKLFNDGTLGQGASNLKEALRIEGVESTGDKISSLGGLLSGLDAGVLKNEGAFDALGQQLGGLAAKSLPAAQQAFAGIAKQYSLSASDQQKLLGLMPAYKDELTKQAAAAHISATDHNLLLLAQGKGTVSVKALAAAQAAASAATTRQAGTIADLAGQASSATTSIDDLQKTIEGFGSAQLDARSATRAMYQAIDDATAAVKKNGAGLSVHTQAGRDNAAALDGIATAADNASSKILKQTGSVKDAQAAMQTGRDAYIKAAEAMGLSKDAAKKLADQLELIPKNITTAVGVSGYGAAEKALRDYMALVNGVPRYLRTQVSVDAINNTGFNGTGPLKTKADGGAIDGPGPKGVDSVRALLAPGEHVLTARDVDLLGGQGGAYAFRRSLESGGVQRFAKGGAVKKKPATDAISVHDAAAAAAKKVVAAKTKEIAADKKKLAVQTKASKAATAKETKAKNAAAAISGKGTSAAKHAAEMTARAATAAAKAAAAKVTATTKKVAADTKAKDDATTAQQDAASAALTLRQNSEDFVSTQTRATPDSPIDPLSYVDQLRSMSRDSNFSPAQQKAYDTAAKNAEGSLVKLQTQATAAATALSTLQDSSKQMHDTITSSIAGGYTLSGAATAQSTGNWTTRDGIKYQTTSGGGTASSIAGYYQAGAGSALQFADVLKQLAGRGLNSALLAELAGMGTDQGLPIAQAILSGSAADLQSINSGYGAIQSIASSAGTTVADANYAAQITAADANAQQITDEIATQGEALRKVIATAFGLKGYAVGTRNATPGLHWVGEHGPELAGFAGGETVLTAGASKHWVRGQGGSGAAPTISVQPPQVQMPDTITVKDASGFELKMRVISRQEIHSDAAQDAVLMMGGAA